MIDDMRVRLRPAGTRRQASINHRNEDRGTPRLPGGSRLQKVLSILLPLVFLAAPGGFLHGAAAAAGPYHHIVVLSDLHLPGRNLEAKERAVDHVNSWSDVHSVVLLGDICDRRGTEEEYAFAKQFLSRLRKPYYPITGNHDYLYEQDSCLQGNRKGRPEGTLLQQKTAASPSRFSFCRQPLFKPSRGNLAEAARVVRGRAGPEQDGADDRFLSCAAERNPSRPMPSRRF